MQTETVQRLLRSRLSDYDYQQHFGGVLYLFLRGMSPQRGASCGVFYERPAAALITALDDYLGHRGAD